MSETPKKRGPRLEYDPRPKLAHIPGIEVKTSEWHKRAIITAGEFRLGVVVHKTAGSDPRGWFWSFILGSGEPTCAAHFNLRYQINQALNG